MSGIDNTVKVTVPTEAVLVEVTAWPDEVQVEVRAKDGNLTPQQARETAAALWQAAEQAPYLDWDAANPEQLVERHHDSDSAPAIAQILEQITALRRELDAAIEKTSSTR